VPPNEKTDPEKTDPGRKKVLVIDDDSTIRAMMSLMLRTCNVKIYDARNGLEGSALAELIPPQLILLDITMPGMDGIEVVKRLRAHTSEVLQKVPIVMFTASPENLRKQAMDAGANAVLEKPAPRQLLIQFIEMYLGPVCSKGRHP
jgi:CheY-like chemotaxis protein